MRKFYPIGLVLLFCLFPLSLLAQNAQPNAGCDLFFKQLGLCAEIVDWRNLDCAVPKLIEGPEVNQKLGIRLRFWLPEENPQGPRVYIDPTTAIAAGDIPKELHAYFWMTHVKGEDGEQLWNKNRQQQNQPHGTRPIKIAKQVPAEDKNGYPLFDLTDSLLDMAGFWQLKLVWTKPSAGNFEVSTLHASTTLVNARGRLLPPSAVQENVLDEAVFKFYVNTGVVEKVPVGRSPLAGASLPDIDDSRAAVAFGQGDERYTLLLFLSVACPCVRDHLRYLPGQLNRPEFANKLRVIGIHTYQNTSNEQASSVYRDQFHLDFPVIRDAGRRLATYYEQGTGVAFTTPYVVLLKPGGFDAETHVVFQGSPTDTPLPVVPPGSSELKLRTGVKDFLWENLQALINNQPLPHRLSEPVGCYILPWRQ